MTEDHLRLRIQIHQGADADEREIDELTAGLRRQLLEVDVQSVERIRAGQAPPGTRAVDPTVLGGLLVTLSTSPELLKMVAGLAQTWVASHHGRTVELEIAGDKLKMTGASSDEQRQLVELFVDRHARRG